MVSHSNYFYGKAGSYDPQFQDNPPWLQIVLLLPADAAQQWREVKALGSILRVTGTKDLQELDLRSKLTNPRQRIGLHGSTSHHRAKRSMESWATPLTPASCFLTHKIRTIDSTYCRGCFND